MKRFAKFVAVAALALVAAGTSFAQKVGDNLLWSSTTVIPAAKLGFAAKQVTGTAPSGKKALIVSAEKNGNEIDFRARIDFSAPVQIRGASKIIVEWEPLDASIKDKGGMPINFSIFTLNPEDNKALRSKTLDYAKRGEDKKSIFMKNGNDGFQGLKASWDLTADYQAWTDTSWDSSTKKVTALELYSYLGGSGSASDYKGIAITAIRFE